jgi:hypothetical protein
MQRAEREFVDEVRAAAGRLRKELGDASPAVALAAALRLAAELALEQRVRPGLFEEGAREHFLRVDHERRHGRAPRPSPALRLVVG